MIKNNGEGTLEIRNFPNGKGEILLLHRFNQEEMFDKCSFCAEIFFAPGQSMGYHKHEKDMEIVYVLSGEIVTVKMTDQKGQFTLDQWQLLGLGKAMVCGMILIKMPKFYPLFSIRACFY